MAAKDDNSMKDTLKTSGESPVPVQIMIPKEDSIEEPNGSWRSWSRWVRGKINEQGAKLDTLDAKLDKLQVSLEVQKTKLYFYNGIITLVVASIATAFVNHIF